MIDITIKKNNQSMTADNGDHQHFANDCKIEIYYQEGICIQSHGHDHQTGEILNASIKIDCDHDLINHLKLLLDSITNSDIKDYYEGS